MLNDNIQKLSIYIVGLICTHILLAHLLALINQNYIFSAYLSLIILAIGLILYTVKSKLVKSYIELAKQLFLNKHSMLVLLSALALGTTMYFRNELLGTPDRVHVASIATLTNEIYPPVSPINITASQKTYHYGPDLLGASIVAITNVPVWQALSIEVGFGAFLFFISLYSLMRFFIQSNLMCLLATLFVTFYTSINSLDFFIREIGSLFNSDPNDFLKRWLIASWTSVSHVTSQLRLPSQNISFCSAFTLFSLLLIERDIKRNEIFKQNNILYFVSMVIVSFMLYLCYPAFWYTILAASVAFFILKRNLIWLLRIISMYIGKILCFSASQSHFNDIQTFIFAPSLKWPNWGKGYLSYFYDPDYIRTLATGFNPVTFQAQLEIPLFSNISFRDFGFSALIAISIATYFFIKNKYNIDTSHLIFITACSSLAVPFLFKFILLPIAVDRFLMWAKVLFLIFASTHVSNFVANYYSSLSLQSIQDFPKNRKDSKSESRVTQKHTATSLILKIFVGMSLVILLTPGIISVIPSEKYAILSNKTLSETEKNLIKELQKVHRSGDIALDSKTFEIGADFISLAGFYGVGGQVFKNDLMTRKTAMWTMSPKLFNELNISYVLIDPQSQISSIGLQRLHDPKFFEEVKEINQKVPDHRLYRFIGHDPATVKDEPRVTSVQGEYLWVLGFPKGDDFVPITTKEGKMIAYETQEEAKQHVPEYKAMFKESNPIVAIWLKEQAVAKDFLK